ncbi:MAG: dipeptide epimerase [Cyclobacteriaceae bacterium]|nr:dipeptide epimerase [Cyclobacteriaceae bacterium]
MQDKIIRELRLSNLDVELTDHFTISQGSVKKVNNLLVSLTLADGTNGYGEITPFQELAGEDRETCILKFNEIRDSLIGTSVLNIRKHSHFLEEALPDSPAVRCGLEMSMIDALTRQLEIPLWAYWGGRSDQTLITDVTIPILPFERSIQLAEHWLAKGFDTLKVKVGSDSDNELKILRGIFQLNNQVKFIIDANQGFDEYSALSFIREVLHFGCKVILFEQPVNRYDLDSMAKITKVLNIPVAADESVFSLQDLRKVIKAGAGRVVNLKIMKTGIFQALQIASTALAFGLDLMIGGMVETRLAMGCSVSIAMGYCPIKYIDLDTPLLMRSDPLLGGYSYCGSEIRSWENPGLGMVPLF